MWTIILDILGKYWKPIALVLVIGGAVGYVSLLRHEVKSEASTIAVQKAQIKTITDANVQLNAAIVVQNKSISAAHDALVADEKSMKDLQSQIGLQQVKVQTQIKYIEAQPVPATCDAAIKFLIYNRPKS